MWKFLRNLNIGGKLNIGFGLLVAVTLSVVVLGAIGGREATEKINLTEELRLPTAQASAQAQASLLEMLTNVRGYLVLGEPQYQVNYNQAKQIFETSLIELEKLSANWTDTEDIERLNDLKTTFVEWSELPEQVFRLHDNPAENQPALPLVRLEYQPLVNIILDKTNELIKIQKQQTQTKENRELLEALLDFQASLNTMFINLQGYAISGDLTFKFAYSTHSSANAAAWENIQAKQSLLDDDRQTRLNSIAQNRKELSPLLVQIFEAAEGERVYEDLYLFRTEAVPRAEQMLQLLDELTTRQQTLLQTDLSNARQSLANARLQTLVGGVLALVLGIVMAFMFKENIAGPVRRLTNTAEQIIGGDLAAQAKVESGDEIGRLAVTLNTMTGRLSQTIDSLEKRTQQLEVSEKKFRSLFEDSKDTIFITTPIGEIIDINPAGLSLLGYTREEMKKMNVWGIYATPDERLRFRKEIEQHGLVRDFEVKLRRKDNTDIDCLLTATVRQADDGTILNYQGIIHDITERKRIERERLKLSAIQRELTIAQSIQQSLLLPPKPNWPNLDVVCYSTPAREVGGDFYTYHAFTPLVEKDENGKPKTAISPSSRISQPEYSSFALAVGDVSGKGMPAALLMAVSLVHFNLLLIANLPRENYWPI
jgi:PAS domain S-box-containing protein